MRTILHSLTLCLATLGGLDAVAQFPNMLVVNGTVSGCYPGQTVTLTTTGGTSPAYTIEIPVAPNTCTFWVPLDFGSEYATYNITTLCGGMIVNVYDSTSLAAGDTTLSFVSLNCGNSSPDCEGVLGGTAVPGSPCMAPSGAAGTWSANCDCVQNIPACNACFSLDTAQQVAWQATFLNCTSGGASPYTYFWTFTNGSTSTTTSDPTITFNSPGAFAVCLTTFDTNGCEDMTCDTVYVDLNGNVTTAINTSDCLGIAGGSAWPGTPCQILGTTLTGIWNSACVCEQNNTVPCQAGFWVIQAYDSTPGGVIVPIPNELWIWNLSSGGTGLFQFLWNFGDGTSSTEAYPTHMYADGGPYVLCLTATDSEGCSSTYCDSIGVNGDGIFNGVLGSNNRSTFSISVRPQGTTAVEENSTMAELNVWPNPVQDQLNITLNSRITGLVDIAVIDMNGRVVATQRQGLTTGSIRLSVDASRFDAGLYMLRISNGKESLTQRFVRTH